MKLRLFLILFATVFLISINSPVTASHTGVQTTLVSINAAGTNSGNGYSSTSPWQPDPVSHTTANGRFVTFLSTATDLVSGMSDTFASWDVFARDLQTGTTMLVSVNASGTGAGNRESYALQQITPDGRFVVFASEATNLVSGIVDTNTNSDVFIRDIVAGTTRLVSVNKNGNRTGDSFSNSPTVSANGRFVAFTSAARDLIPNFVDGNDPPVGVYLHAPDVFVRDVVAGVTRLVSVNRGNTTRGGDWHSVGARISADGRFVFFGSVASDLLPAITDNNGLPDVYVRDLAARTTSLAIPNFSGGFRNGGLSVPLYYTITPDARFIGFSTDATNLVPIVDGNSNSGNGNLDVFIRDLTTGTTSLVSINAAGSASGNGSSGRLSLTPDGRFMAFTSWSSDLVSMAFTGRFPDLVLKDTNNVPDVFVRDIAARTTHAVSINRAGTDMGMTTQNGSATTHHQSISSDGRFVVFYSDDVDLVDNDTNSAPDVFLRDLVARTTTMLSINREGTNSGNGNSFLPIISDDGSIMVFESDASDLVDNDNSIFTDIFAVKLGRNVDLDIDSDNNNLQNPPDRTDNEDHIEDDPTKSGKFVLSNIHDKDNDAVLDFADGFNWDGISGNADDINAQEKFIPLILEVKAPIDLAQARFRLTYSASDPAGVTTTGRSPNVIYTPAPGNLRIWSKKGNVARNKAKVNAGGDFVAPTKDEGGQDWWRIELYTASQLGLSGATRIVTLYVEGIAASATLGDQRILVEVDPDGPGPTGFTEIDAIRSTDIRVDLDVDTNRDTTVDDKDEADQHKWEKGLGKRGATVLANSDKDNTLLEAPDNYCHTCPTYALTAGDWDLDLTAEASERPNRNVDDNNDKADLGPLWLHKLGPDSFPDDLKIILEVSQPAPELSFFAPAAAQQRLRVFRPTEVSGNDLVIKGADPTSGYLGDEAVIGPEAGAKFEFVKTAGATDINSYDIFKRSGVVNFGVEGIEFGSMVDIKVTVKLGTTTIAPEEKVRIRIAPFTLLDHTNGVKVGASAGKTVYVKDGLSTSLITELTAKYGGNLDVTTIADPWHQDGYEIGYAKAPYGTIPVVLSLPRGSRFGNLFYQYVHNTLLRKDVGVNTRVEAAIFGDQDDGGNLESIPVPGGTDPGKFFYGLGMDPNIVNFFTAQDVNAPKDVNVSWLKVGHVDEVVSFAPDGHRVVVADPEVAWALLLWASSIDGTATMLDGMNPGAPLPLRGPVVVQDVVDPLSRLRTFNMTTVMDPTNLPKIISDLGLPSPESTPVQDPANTGTATLNRTGAFIGLFPNNNKREYKITFIDATDYMLEYREEGTPLFTRDPENGKITEDKVFKSAKAFILSDWWSGAPAANDKFTFEANPNSKTIEMPVLFWNDVGASAYTTNHVNSIVDGSTIITGKAFGPEVDYLGTGRRDILTDYVKAMFSKAGYTTIIGLEAPNEIDAREYHNACGLIHCGTNVQRVIPGFKWWEK